MKRNLLAIISIMLAGIIVLAFPVDIFVQGEDKGGSDDKIEMSADAGGSGEFDWNQLHGFAISEEGEKIEEDSFNVTVCKTVKYKDNEYKPSGHIFGELHDIYMQDNPEPSITISNEDFEQEKDDENNLTLYVYGEYDNTSKPGEPEHRYAYIQLTITKPNNPPVPVAWVAVEGNWTWVNLSEKNDVTFIDEEGEGLTVFFDASHSWDPDQENIEAWRWDLDEDGEFGQSGGEKNENTSTVLTAGKSYYLGLLVIDARDAISPQPLDFVIRIRSPELKPDLVVDEITYENNKQGKLNYEVEDMINVYPKIKNIGKNDTLGSFKVLIEYSTDNGATYEHLAEYEITEKLTPGKFNIYTYKWDTGGFAKGKYKLRATADKEKDIDEEYEDNNENITNLINLEEKEDPGDPLLSIESVIVDRTQVYINEQVNINVTIKNEGDGIGTWIDVEYSINGEYQYLNSIEVIPAGENKTTFFTFTGDIEDTYILSFTAKDNKEQVGQIETVTILVQKETPPNGNGNGNGKDDDDGGGSGFIPGFEFLPLMGAALAATILFGIRRRK